MMKIFQFNPLDYQEEFRQKGFAHISGGVAPEFLAWVQNKTNALVEQDKQLNEWHIKKKKVQYLLDFPEYSDFPDGVYKAIANVVGVSENSLTLCERHIKVYEDVAENNPPPHKDRVASQFTVGLPLSVPNNSYLILYPKNHLEINPYATTALWRTSLDEEFLPENVLKNIEPVKINTLPGDVVIFRGSSIYHERVNPANTRLLYLKFNTMRLDPLGEDLSTPLQRARSKDLLCNKTGLDLLSSKVVVSPRLEGVNRIYTRLNWKEVIQGRLWGQKEFTISELEFRILMKLDTPKTISEILTLLGIEINSHVNYFQYFRRLIMLEAIDLLD